MSFKALVLLHELCLFFRLFVFGATTPLRARASSFTRFLDHAQQQTAVGRTLLDEWPTRHRDLCLNTHNTHNRCPRWHSNPRF